MLFHLLYRVLGDEIGWLRVFRYPSTRILAAAITALLLSFVIGPWFIERLKARQIGETIRSDGPETHTRPVDAPAPRPRDSERSFSHAGRCSGVTTWPMRALVSARMRSLSRRRSASGASRSAANRRRD